VSLLLRAVPITPFDNDVDPDSWGRKYIPGTTQAYARGRHGGLDLQGSHWVACATGIVRRRSYGSAYGIQAQIDFAVDGHVYEATYSHGAACYFTNGEAIKAGSILGKVGDTGQALGAHLHFELHETPGVWTSDFDPWRAVMAASFTEAEIDALKQIVATMKAAGSNPSFIKETIELVRALPDATAKLVAPHLANQTIHTPPSGVPAHTHDITGTAS
jgi:murein DD-endopeptidase MepM/ murein hydrolase activator NlpD